MDGVLGFNFSNHPRASHFKEDLAITSPQTTYDLLKFFGAVNGTRNWIYNANMLVKNGECKLGDIPSHRDDVFMMLRNDDGIDTSIALNIANKVSKGLHSNELTDNERTLLEALDLPEWFIPYIEKVRYMSSKATTIGMLQIALAFLWYKIQFPEKFNV